MATPKRGMVPKIFVAHCPPFLKILPTPMHSVVPSCCMEVVSERVGLILDKMSGNTKQATHTGVVIVVNVMFLKIYMVDNFLANRHCIMYCTSFWLFIMLIQWNDRTVETRSFYNISKFIY